MWTCWYLRKYFGFISHRYFNLFTKYLLYVDFIWCFWWYWNGSSLFTEHSYRWILFRKKTSYCNRFVRRVQIFNCLFGLIFLGIVTAGTGIGSITFGPFSSFLFTTYGWKIGLVILASMMLICTIASSIMVPVKSVLQNDQTYV